MITTQARPAVPPTQAPQITPGGSSGLDQEALDHLAVIGGLLIIVAAANAWNLMGWPLWHDDDQGTYVAQARAVIMPSHHIAHYTYWYDHTPGGWALMGVYFWVTDALGRYPLAVMAGREFMWEINLVGSAALYVLARRLNMRRASAAAAVVLFGLSPLAIFYHRMVFLDNIATVFLLVALALAASPRRSLGTVIGGAACMSAAFWSKETVALMVPAWLWIVWRHSDRRHRGFWVAGAVFFLTSVVGYPLFALLRNELFPGKGHVSLIWSLKWATGFAATDRQLAEYALGHICRGSDLGPPGPMAGARRTEPDGGGSFHPEAVAVRPGHGHHSGHSDQGRLCPECIHHGRAAVPRPDHRGRGRHLVEPHPAVHIRSTSP